MSNEGIRIALGRPAAALLVLTAGTLLLPAPWSPGTWNAPGAGTAVLGAAVLAAAAVLIWVLLLWTTAVTVLLLAAGGAGRVGRLARAALRHVLPAAARGTVTATIGLSLLGGCAVHATDHSPDTSKAAIGAVAASAGRSTTVLTAVQIDGSGTGTIRGVSFPPGASMSASATRALPMLAPRAVPLQPDAEAPAAAPAAARTTRAGVPANINVDWPGPAPSAGSSVGAEPAVVVVHRGDTLWAIAARHLGGRPTDAQIDHAWRVWYATNHDVIGPDPDLILPGQQLRPPTIDSHGGS